MEEYAEGTPTTSSSIAMNGCCSSISVVHLSSGFLTKHRRRKSFPSSEKSVGISGNSSLNPILKSNPHAAWPPSNKPAQAGRPVAISATTHPRDHTSAAAPYSPSATASGDMYIGVPRMPPPPRASQPSSILFASPKSAILTTSAAAPTTMRVPSRVHVAQPEQNRAHKAPDGGFRERSTSAAERVAERAGGSVLEEEIIRLGAGGRVGGDVVAEAADQVGAIAEVVEHGLLMAEEAGGGERRRLHRHQRRELSGAAVGETDGSEAATADDLSSSPLLGWSSFIFSVHQLLV
ncbi:hypothetical protein Cni_G01262 [Canna indica]|uniref:Uncharacterized protein n=1 Tax=Canna indica TaxID=4628 RepID=A0AAQ3JM90_9LILI|nr:hypothetical protein Cni_G01262 [Canna indica]